MKLEELSPNRCVAYYMMSSYLYYEKDKNVITDSLFEKDQLTAGTGYYIKYTNMIKYAAESWYNENRKTKMTPRQLAGQSSLENFFK